MAHQPAKKKQKVESEQCDDTNKHNIILWKADDINCWEDRLNDYSACIKEKVANKLLKANSGKRLIELDNWYYNELPLIVTERREKGKNDGVYLTCEELVDMTEWKMLRGKWRPKNKELVASNSQESLNKACEQAIQALQTKASQNSNTSNIKKAISIISELKGVGPATSSAVLCVFDESVPFMSDEATLTALPQQPLKYTLTQYVEYASKMQDKANSLNSKGGRRWTCKEVEKAVCCDVKSRTL